MQYVLEELEIIYNWLKYHTCSFHYLTLRLTVEIKFYNGIYPAVSYLSVYSDQPTVWTNVVRYPLLCKMTFSCPICPSSLSRNVLYSVGTGGHFCGNYTSNVEINVTGPSI